MEADYFFSSEKSMLDGVGGDENWNSFKIT